MVIFISDLHLTDGSFDYDNMVHDTSAEAYKLFWDDILSIVTANKEAKINKINVVLLGDILELRTTTEWMKVKTRPWMESPEELSAEALAVLNHIISKIIYDPATRQPRQRTLYLSNLYLDRFDSPTGLSKLILEKKIDVSFTYVPGNHDRLILVGNNPILRNFITNSLGWKIVGPDTLSDYPNEPRFRCPDLGIIANHGHGVDAIDFYNDYLQPTIGDLLPDIVGRMMTYAREMENLSPAEKKDLVKVVLNLDLVRPTTSQLDWLLQKITSLESNAPRAVSTCLKEIIIRTLKDLLANADTILDFLYPRIESKIRKFEAIAISSFILQNPAIFLSLFKKKKDVFLGLLKKIVQVAIDKLDKDPKKFVESLDAMAKSINRILPEKKKNINKEENYALELLKEKGCSFVLLGHTHNYEICPLGSNKDGYYFNTGTWKKTVVKNYSLQEISGFQRWARMTYITFFEKGENKDHIFDLWHGNLQFEEDKLI